VRQLCHQARAANIDADRLGRVDLKHGDVLVRGGVEDQLRLVLGEQRAHPPFVGDVCQHRQNDVFAALAGAAEFGHQIVQAALVVVQHQQLDRRIVEKLAAQFGADRPGGAGDQHDLPSHRRHIDVFVPAYRLAAKQIFRRDLAQQRGRHGTVELGEDIRDGVDPRRCLLAVSQHVRKIRAGDVVDGDYDQVNVVRLDNRRDILPAAEHAAALDEHARFARVVIDEADDLVLLVRVGRAVLQTQRRHAAGLAGADDQDALFGGLVREFLPPDGAPAPLQPADHA